MKDKFEKTVHEIGYENTKVDKLSKRASDLKTLSWNYFTKGWNNNGGGEIIYCDDIFKHDTFLYRLKKYVLPKKRFKEFAGELFSAVWGEFYGRCQYESSITVWPIAISSDELANAMDNILNGETILYNLKLPNQKVSVGDMIFFNWVPFAEYVWNNKKILKEMVKNIK